MTPRNGLSVAVCSAPLRARRSGARRVAGQVPRWARRSVRPPVRLAAPPPPPRHMVSPTDIPAITAIRFITLTMAIPDTTVITATTDNDGAASRPHLLNPQL